MYWKKTRIPTTTAVSKKRLMVDLCTICEAYEKVELSVVTWIRSKNNSADTLTKGKKNTIITMGRVDHPMGQ